MSDSNRSDFAYTTFIRTTSAKLWEALTQPQCVRQYWFGMIVECGWENGSPWKIVGPDGTVYDKGEIKAEDVEDMSQRIVESGLVRKLEVPDPHLYFQAPGGQCLRLVGINEASPSTKGREKARMCPR